MRYLLLFMICLVATSCSIQKRHYRPGFFVQGFRQDKTTARAFPENEKKRDTSVQQHHVASAEPGALPVVFAADAIRQAGPEMVNPISPDTLLPGKKTKRQPKSRPGDTPEETAARKQYQFEFFAGALLLLLGFALTVLSGYNIGLGSVIAGPFTGLIFTVIGMILLLMASSSKSQLKHVGSGGINGSAADDKLPGREKVLAENRLNIAVITTLSLLIQFLLFRTGKLSLFNLLFLAGLFAGVMFIIISLIILLTINHRIQKSSGKKRQEHKTRNHKTHGKYYVPVKLAIIGLQLIIAGLVGLYILDDYVLFLVSTVFGGVGTVMLIVALVWIIVVTLIKLIRRLLIKNKIPEVE